MSRPVYVVLEGGDGSGKTVQATRLIDWFRQQTRLVRHLREPGSTATGEALRRLLLDPETGEIEPVTEALLFSAARAELVQQQIAPAMEAGESVVVERCYLSTLVYQGAAGDVSTGLLRDVTAVVQKDVWPDGVFVLDVDEATRIQRVPPADMRDRIEGRNDQFHRRVRQSYLDLAEADPRVSVIDATGTVAEVQEELRRHVASLLEVD